MNRQAHTHNAIYMEGATMTQGGRVKHFKTGYIVAMTKQISKVLGKEIRDIYNYNQIEGLINELNTKPQMLGIINKRYGNLMVGFWKSEGKTYWDIVIRTSSKFEAVAIATHQREIAIWDCKRECEIEID